MTRKSWINRGFYDLQPSQREDWNKKKESALYNILQHTLVISQRHKYMKYPPIIRIQE